MPHTIRIGVIQSRTNPTAAGLRVNPFGDDFVRTDLFEAVERHLAWFEARLAEAAADRCRLAVITEDFTRLGMACTYLDDRDLFREAVTRQTPLVAERLGAAARKHGMYIVASYYALEGAAIYNVADLFEPGGGIAGRYRKVHLPLYEQWQVQAGSVFPAFETDIGWIGMLVCYDQMWPESVACCALNGAQMICQPSAASLPDYHMRTRARDAQVHMLSATYAYSMIVSPGAEILADAGEREHAVVWADVNPDAATEADEFYWEHLYSGIRNHKERHLKFRRPDAYGPITASRPPLADRYPGGGRADTPEAVAEVYRIHKVMQQKLARGEATPYHWRWQVDPAGP